MGGVRVFKLIEDPIEKGARICYVYIKNSLGQKYQKIKRRVTSLKNEKVCATEEVGS